MGTEKNRTEEEVDDDGPSMTRLETSGVWLRGLGRERVVVAFAALALAAEDDGRGQEEERWGDEQEQAETGEDAHNLPGAKRRRLGWDGPKVLGFTKNVNISL